MTSPIVVSALPSEADMCSADYGISTFIRNSGHYAGLVSK